MSKCVAKSDQLIDEIISPELQSCWWEVVEDEEEKEDEEIDAPWTFLSPRAVPVKELLLMAINQNSGRGKVE